ncbi:hypothetical protein B0J13DRAFT_108654 [Dactylonectria estremocensis]|uniref:Zn(2)-C6 fungal-type domain-containing protein n=1 Tax=Dactylonectria estremocensis TaxID=1079267 RepID=A0A9P9JFH9_9HYPO|nr:hypothetical protein B0J13DRAFT_108654 [Dactylonectria estremocensis]
MTPKSPQSANFHDTAASGDGQQIEDEPVSDAGLPSCESCRKRKLKCSRRKPVCSNCERLDTLCVYELKRNKPGLKSGAVEGLNRRLELVEQVLFNQDDHNGGHSPQGSNPTPEQQSPRTSFQKDDSLRSTPVVEALSTLAQEIRHLSSVFSHQPRPPPSAHHPHQEEEFSSSRPPKRRRLDDPCAESLSNSHEDANQLLGDESDSFNHLVGHDLLPALLDCYFQRVQPWIAVLHEANFRLKLQKPGGLKRLSVIIHAITVAALHFVRRHEQPLSPTEVSAQQKKSRTCIALTAMNELSVENMQALIILVFTDIGNGNSHKAWATVASLSRSVEYLQLSVESEGRQKRAAILRPLPSLSEPKSWVEEEERRRVFWNVFMLDRFCSVATGWNTSLTAADVCRRLPVCGGLWYKSTPAQTPYFGIWDRSAAKMGNSITFLPAHYPSPTHSNNTELNDGGTPAARSSGSTTQTIDMTNVGALAYNIESLESLSRINAYFLQQNVDFSDRKEVSSWLTRFKELDLRLVHWKMFLPQQWQDSGISRETMPGVMDPNMTAAHATHNTSMILLHQRIAYPSAELADLKLPTFCSAETCQGAAIETATITRKYLDSSPKDTLVSPQLALAAFVSARVLLIHSRFYGTTLINDFWILVENLKEMSTRWTNDSIAQRQSIFGQFALRLQRLYERYQQDPNFQLDVSGYNEDLDLNQVLSLPRERQQEQSRGPLAPNPHQRNGHEPFDAGPRSKSVQNSLVTSGSHSETAARGGSKDWVQPLNNVEGDELATISQILMDQRFMEMDRVISFDDMMFTSRPSQTMPTSLNHSWNVAQSEDPNVLTADNCPVIYWDTN